MYSRIITEEMAVEDFSLETDKARLNKLVSSVFGTREYYLDGDLTKIVSPDEGAKSWEHHARAYLNLLASPGRNEPDDRVYSVEIIFNHKVALAGDLLAVIVSHTHWNETESAPWLTQLHDDGAKILPYMFVPGRHPEHYHALLEIEVKNFYKREGYI